MTTLAEKLSELSTSMASRDLLREAGIFKYLLKIGEDVSLWEKVIEETSNIQPPFDLSSITELLKDSGTRLAKAENITKDLSKEELEEVAGYAKQSQRMASKKFKTILKMAEDQIPGGLSDQAQIKDFDPEDLLDGAKIELEHTDDLMIALEIASDHLSEDPNYYLKLKKMETKQAGAKHKLLGLLPWVGTVFNIIFALRSINVAGKEIVNKLQPLASEIGISPWIALHPIELETMISKFDNDPRKMLTLAQIAKSGKILWAEGLNAITNLVDGAKDAVFALLNLGGWPIAVDMGLSVLLLANQLSETSDVHKNYNSILEKIKAVAESKILNLPTKESEKSWLDMTDQEKAESLEGIF